MGDRFTKVQVFIGPLCRSPLISLCVGDDLIWEADDMIYDPYEIITQNGYLVMRVNSMSSGAILRLRGLLCLNRGFVEVGVGSTEGHTKKRVYVSITSNILRAWLSRLYGSGLVLGVLPTKSLSSYLTVRV